MIQLRGKKLSSRRFYQLALEIKSLTAPWNPIIIINDRIDIALLCNAHGVHLGSNDIPVPEARRILGSNCILGKTAKSLREIREAEEEGAHYLGIGSAFPSPTKPEALSLSPREIHNLAQKTSLPVYGIGGIRRQNFKLISHPSLFGVALSSGILKAPNPLEEFLWFYSRLSEKSPKE